MEEAARPIDEIARDKAVCPRRSVLVRAPAGSGKTTLLARRYLMLLGEDGVEPEHILCLTFTRKASGQMRKAIGKLIPADYRDRVNVHTIDGFQRSLARADSLRARILPRFRMMERRDSLDRAIAEAGEQAEKVCNCKDLKEHYSRKAIHRKMANMLAKRDQWKTNKTSVQHERAHTRKPRRTVEDADAGQPDHHVGIDVLDGLQDIAEHALERVHWMEREYDYIAVSEAATELLRRLGERPELDELQAVLGHPVSHILVDEFQDVSAAQARFFEKLVGGWEGGGRTFFAVGDSMQSIYRFRGAGTEVIRNMFEEKVAKIGRHRLDVVELTSNFRSAEAVVDGVYSLLYRGDDRKRDERGEARLVRARATGKFEQSGEFGLRVFEVEEKVFEVEAEEGAWVAERMEEFKKSDEELAVLLRARVHYTRHIEPRLTSCDNIDVDFAPLDLQACVNDMCTLARCIEDPENETTVLALLRSPLLGLGSAEIRSIYGSRGGAVERRTTPLADVLNERSDSDRPRWETELGEHSDSARAIREFAATFWRARAEMRRMPVRSWLERAWFRAGGGALYSRREDQENVKQLLDLVEEVSGRSRRCDWRELERAMHLARGASRWPLAKVKVMTIHEAKGLEFDHVIVPFLHKKKPDSKRDLVMIDRRHIEKEKRDASADDNGQKYDEDEKYGEEATLDNKGEKYEKLREKEREKDCEELRRLLYVAATRAKKSCWLTVTSAWVCGGRGERKYKDLDKMSTIAQVKGVKSGEDLKSLRTAIKRRIGELEPCNIAEVICPGGKESRTDSATYSGVNEGEPSVRVVGFERLKKHMDRVKPLCENRKFRRPAADSQSAAIGVVMHEEISRMLTALTAWPADGMAGYLGGVWERQCRADLREAGAKDVDAGVEEVRRQIERIGRDERVMKRLWAANTAGSGWRLEFEREFRQVEVENQEEKEPRRADLLVWDEAKRNCLVIDFKTGEEKEDHDKQVKEYQELLRRACPGTITGGALYFTQRAELRWGEWGRGHRTAAFRRGNGLLTGRGDSSSIRTGTRPVTPNSIAGRESFHRYHPAPGPTGRPSNIHTTSISDQQARKTTV